MSLINRMLQELDARGTAATGTGMLQGQVRAVPQQRGIHPAWWLVMVLSIALLLAGGWLWFARAKPESGAPITPNTPIAPNALSLKMDTDVSRIGFPQASSALELASQADVQALALDSAAMPVQPAPKLSVSLPVHSSSSAHPDSGKAVAAMPVHPGMPPPSSGAAPVQAVASAKSATATAPIISPVPSPSLPALTKQVKELTPQQQAENEYRRGTLLIQQGRVADALASLEQALQLDGHHVAARQTLVALLIDARRLDEAIRKLREGLQNDAAQTGLAMILARLQVDRGDLKPALDTLQGSLPYAAEKADYYAFLGALLQRDGRHREAVEHYAIALRKTPQNSIWWMGMAISLQAENRTKEAIDAFTRAKAGNGLSPELKAFVEEKLTVLQRQL